MHDVDMLGRPQRIDERMRGVGAFRVYLLIGVRGRKVNRVGDRAECQAEAAETRTVAVMGPVDTPDERSRVRACRDQLLPHCARRAREPGAHEGLPLTIVQATVEPMTEDERSD